MQKSMKERQCWQLQLYTDLNSGSLTSWKEQKRKRCFWLCVSQAECTATMDSFTLHGGNICRNDPWIKEVSELNINLTNDSLFYAVQASFCSELLTICEIIKKSNQRTGTMTVTLDNRLTVAILNCFLMFRVNRRIYITNENVFRILLGAELLQHTQILNTCLVLLTKKIHLNTVTRLHISAREKDIHSLAEFTSRFMRKSFEEYCSSADFLLLPHAYFKDIIAEKELKVSTEDSILEAVMRWCKHCCPGNTVVLAELLSEVRKSVSDACVERALQDPPTADPVQNESVRKVIRKHFSGGEFRDQREFSEYELFAICQYSYYLYVHAYDIDKDKWRVLSIEECFPEMHCALSVNGSIWGLYTNKIEEFSLGDHVWDHKINTEAYDSEAIVCYENKLYFFGAYLKNTKGLVRILNIATLDIFPEIYSMPSVRLHSAAVVSEECIYVTGGYKPRLYHSSVAKYSPTRNVWYSDVAPMLTERAYHSCGSTEGRIYVCGGRTRNNRYLRSCEMYDLEADQWTVIRDMHFGREKPSVIFNKRHIFTFGGEDRSSNNNMELYDPVANEWTWRSTGPTHVKHCVLVFSDSNYNGNLILTHPSSKSLE